MLRTANVVENEAGEHLRIRFPLEALWPDGPKLLAARRAFLESVVAESKQAVEPSLVVHAELTALARSFPERTLFLDLETCGLTGSALFLIGLLRPIDGQVAVELLLARNYAEEKATLASFWKVMSGCDVLVTFNGKAFDWPMVLDRSTRFHLMSSANWRYDRPHGAEAAPQVEASIHQPPVHFDVLHHARRRWRKSLPDCRLQTLERHICRRGRVGDVPGHLIPAAYAEFVRTGYEREMESILYHNAVDLITLLDLALRLAA